ncbi:MAG: Si-specific NAD(P)(+) transhydrogenase [Phycisphaerae bacterium]|nr:Si-specific NAD(P)(+) transhydrogenase [Phycisphaerae bacterium]
MVTDYDYDLVAIGSGPAGQRAVIQAAKLDKKVAIIEKRSSVGGVCVDIGTIPSKTFREAVLSFSARNHPAHLGSPLPIQCVEQPTLQVLMSRVAEVVRCEQSIVQTQLLRNNVDYFQGQGVFQDPHTLRVQSQAGTREITAENILIAVGTRAARPDLHLPGTDDLIITSDELFNIPELPQAMTIVGGGIIGIEYASIFATLGIEVTVIDKRLRLMSFLDDEIVDELIRQMQQRNVTFHLGEKIASVSTQTEPTPKGTLVLESGKTVTADLTLYSIGRIGDTEGLNLSTVGILPDPSGRLKVDEQFRTEQPHIFAAGDIIGFPSLAATSSEQGRLAACFAFGIQTGAMQAHYPVGIYSIPEISMVGQTEAELTGDKIPYEIGMARYSEIARGQILNDDTGLFKMLFHRETRQLLGVHIIGTGATELVHIGQAVLRLNGGLKYFLETIFNYPTLAECYKVAALNAFNKM